MDPVTHSAETLAVARVDLPTGGTAFAVSDRFALTAFHVVGDRANGVITHPQLRLIFGGGPVAASVDQRSSPVDDVALLHLTEALPTGVIPIPLTSEVHRESWYSRGFPVGDPTRTGSAVDGNVVDPEQRQPDSGADVVALYCQQAAAESAQRLNGFSGAPVLVRDPPRAAGLIRWNPVQPDKPGIALGGTVYACPVRRILDLWPHLRDVAGKDAPDTSEEEHLKRLISQYERNLRITEAQLSNYAASEQPLHLINQLDGIKNELRILRERLGPASGRQVT